MTKSNPGLNHNITNSKSKMATDEKRRPRRGILGHKLGSYPRLIDILLLIITTCVSIVTPETTEVCTGEIFNARCGPDEVIVMDEAEYGRMALGKCIRTEQDHMGCSNQVLTLADRWCSGRRSCQTIIPNPELEIANQACLEYLKLYFKVSYHCIKVFAEAQSKCESMSRVILPANQGFISSQVTDETGCVSMKAPGVIQAASGQRIKFTLLDFATTSRKRSAGPVYAYIMDKTVQINKTIYGGGQRMQDVYTSESAVVEIALANKEERHQEGDFLLQYMVVGCVDLETPGDAWYKRKGDNATVGCKSSAKVWHLHCDGYKWHGTIGNCSVAAIEASTEEDDKGIWAFLFYIIPGVAAAIVLLVIIVVVVCVCQKKKSIKDESRRTIQTPASPSRSGTMSTSARKPAGKYKAMECTVNEDLVYNVNARHQPIRFNKDGVSATCQRKAPIPGSALAQVMMLTQPEPAYQPNADLLDLCIPAAEPECTVVAMEPLAAAPPSGPPPPLPDFPPPEPLQAKYEIVQVKRPKSFLKDGDPNSGSLSRGAPAGPEPPTPQTPPLPTRTDRLSLASSDSSPDGDDDGIYVNEKMVKKTASKASLSKSGSLSNKGSPMLPKRPPRKCDDKTPCTPSPGHIPTAAFSLAAVPCEEIDPSPPFVKETSPALEMPEDDLPPPPPPPESENYYNIDELTGVPKEDPTIPILPDLEPPVMPAPAGPTKPPPVESYYSNDPDCEPLTATHAPSPPGNCGDCYYNNCDCPGDGCKTSVHV